MNCLIIDDERPSREELRFFIQNHSSITILEEFENSIQALKYLQNMEHVDLVFLDINMPNLNGMELAKIINRFKVKPQIIFVSAHREYAHDAFEVEAFDYLLKPYSTDRITRLLRKIENKIKNMGEQAKNPKEGKITLNNGEKIIVLKTDDITFIRANERRTEVFFKNEKFSANIKFSDMEEKYLLSILSVFHQHYRISPFHKLTCIGNLHR